MVEFVVSIQFPMRHVIKIVRNSIIEPPISITPPCQSCISTEQFNVGPYLTNYALIQNKLSEAPDDINLLEYDYQILHTLLNSALKYSTLLYNIILLFQNSRQSVAFTCVSWRRDDIRKGGNAEVFQLVFFTGSFCSTSYNFDPATVVLWYFPCECGVWVMTYD